MIRNEPLFSIQLLWETCDGEECPWKEDGEEYKFNFEDWKRVFM
jgi:hypothetical protein